MCGLQARPRGPGPDHAQQPVLRADYWPAARDAMHMGVEPGGPFLDFGRHPGLVRHGRLRYLTCPDEYRRMSGRCAQVSSARFLAVPALPVGRVDRHAGPALPRPAPHREPARGPERRRAPGPDGQDGARQRPGRNDLPALSAWELGNHAYWRTRAGVGKDTQGIGRRAQPGTLGQAMASVFGSGNRRLPGHHRHDTPLSLG
jgi:hypothetical protein